jgi:hypothetical protein
LSGAAAAEPPRPEGRGSPRLPPCPPAVLYDWLQAHDQQFLYEKSSKLIYSHDHGHFFPNGPNWNRSELENPPTPRQLIRTIQNTCNLTRLEISEAKDRLRLVTSPSCSIWTPWADRLLLLSHEDDTEPAFADLLQRYAVALRALPGLRHPSPCPAPTGGLNRKRRSSVAEPPRKAASSRLRDTPAEPPRTPGASRT